jgi:formate-dependent nitrite reductase membrane component NrfD
VRMVASIQDRDGDGALSRPVYDAPHMPWPWGGKVSAYLWTKSIAAGTLLVAALATLLGGTPSGVMLGAVAPSVALLFLAITSVLLIGDLKRPDRFHYVLLKGNRTSWLVWGAWILMAYGLLATVWLIGARAGADGLLYALAIPTAILAAATAGYSAFLFGQAEGRDFWQSQLLLPQLLLAAIIAGAAAMLLIGVGIGTERTALQGLAWLMALGLLGHGMLVLVELGTPHANVDVALAARLITRGPWRARFWFGTIGAGLVVPVVVAFLAPPGGGLAVLSAVLALAGLWLYEDTWIKAGQTVPLS